MSGNGDFSDDEINSFLRNVGRGQMSSIRKRLAQGFPVDAANSVGYTPLMAAARNFQTELVALFLAEGADVHARALNTRATPLHAALGAKPTPPPGTGPTDGPLDAERQAECVRLLLEAGADPNQRDHLGMTPLMHAAWWGCSEAARLLLEGKADPNVRSDNGDTADDIAEARGNIAVSAVIRERRLSK